MKKCFNKNIKYKVFTKSLISIYFFHIKQEILFNVSSFKHIYFLYEDKMYSREIYLLVEFIFNLKCNKYPVYNVTYKICSQMVDIEEKWQREIVDLRMGDNIYFATP